MKRLTHFWYFSQETVWPGVLFIAFFAFTAFSLDWGPGIDGVANVGAERVLSGEVPYRDFWTMYAPGQFYLIALLYSIFGVHGIVSTITATILSALSIALVYRIALLLFHKQTYALACALIFLAAQFYGGFYKFLGSYPTGMFFILISLNLYVNYLRDPRPALVPLTGLTIGIAAIFKHDVGAYAAIAVGTGLLVFHLCRLRESPEDNPRLIITRPLWFGMAAAAPVLLTILLLAPYAGADMLQDLIVFPATDFPYTRPEAYPGILPTGIYHPHETKLVLNLANYLTFNLPFFFLLSGALVSLARFRTKDAVTAAAGASFAIVYLFHYWAAHTQINTHIVSMSLYGALMACLTAVWLREKFDWLASNPGRWLAVLLVAGWIASLSVQTGYRLSIRGALVPLDLPKVSGIRDNPSNVAVVRELTRFVQQHVPEHEPLYVGLNRHDALLISEPFFYYLFDRPPATRYHELHPGIVDTLEVQMEIIRDINEQEVRLVVLWKPFNDKSMDKWKSELASHLPKVGATELDQYLARNFTKVAQFGNEVSGYSVMLRNPVTTEATH